MDRDDWLHDDVSTLARNVVSTHTHEDVSTHERFLPSRVAMAKSAFRKFSMSPYREYQEEAVMRILECPKRFCVIEAPTGMGKSIIGMVAGQLTGRTTYLVHSKMLQTQLNGDFEEVPILWGKGNYRCVKHTDTEVMCDCCTHRPKFGNACEYVDKCEYRVDKKKAQASRIRILNYDYFLAEANFIGQFSNNDMVVVDEADSLEDTLIGHIKVEMTERMIRNTGIGYPKFKTATAAEGISSWKKWANDARREISMMHKMLNRVVEAYTDIYSQEQKDNIRRLDQLTMMIRKLDMFLKHVDNTWIYEETDHTQYGKGISFRPVWLTPELADEFMWRHGDKFVLMSATFHKPHVLAKLLGIQLKDIEFHSFPSTFPVDSREVEMNPVANLTFKTMDEEVPKLIEEIERVVNLYPDQKGVIHCVSYSLAKKILDGVHDQEVRKRIITHDGKNKIDQVDVFKYSRHPLVFLSPSSERGISLNDDFCRFIIWAKAPFLNLNDKLVKARIYGNGNVGQDWYVGNMILSVVQGCGRGTRSRDDYCKSYLLDYQIVRNFTGSGGLVPEWFMEACW